MADNGESIRDVQQGQPFTIQRTAYGLPSTVQLTGATFWVKSRLTDDDANALMLIPINVNPSPTGQIVSQDATTGAVAYYFFIYGVSTSATLTVGTLNARYTVTAIKPGYQFNRVTLQQVVGGLNTPLSVGLSGTVQVNGVGVVGTVVTVNVATDGSGAPTSTANDIIAALNGHATVSQLVVATLTSGSSGVSVVSSAAAAPLTGGQTGTDGLLTTGQYLYQITLDLSDNTQLTQETGSIATRNSLSTTLTFTLMSGARAAESGSVRSDTILNSYVDANIEMFRRLKCWDMEGRRYGNDPNLIITPYRRWNATFTPEVYDDQNNPVPYSLVSVDFDAGTVRVADEAGYETYYVTFCFDYFGPDVLKAFLGQTLQELNIAGSENRYTTDYATVDATPLSWDGPLALGVLVKCYRRLGLDAGLWGTRNIWADGAGGQALALEIAAAADASLSELKRGLKWGRFISKPTQAYAATLASGFGFFGGYGSRFGGIGGFGGFNQYAQPF